MKTRLANYLGIFVTQEEMHELIHAVPASVQFEASLETIDEEALDQQLERIQQEKKRRRSLDGGKIRTDRN